MRFNGAIKMHRQTMKRILDQIIEDIEQTERCCYGLGRDAFFRDHLLRDAIEQCLIRIKAATVLIAKCDAKAYTRLQISIALLGSVEVAKSMDRMDSDVLASVIEFCRTQLRQDVLALIKETMLD